MSGEEVSFLEAANGNDALVLAEAHEPDLVVADVSVSPYGGFGPDPRPQGQPRGLLLRVILVLDRLQDEWLGRWSGADALVNRPVDPFALAQVASRLLQEEEEGEATLEGATSRSIPAHCGSCQQRALLDQLLEPSEGFRCPFCGFAFAPSYATIAPGHRPPPGSPTPPWFGPWASLQSMIDGRLLIDRSAVVTPVSDALPGRAPARLTGGPGATADGAHVGSAPPDRSAAPSIPPAAGPPGSCDAWSCLGRHSSVRMASTTTRPSRMTTSTRTVTTSLSLPPGSVRASNVRPKPAAGRCECPEDWMRRFFFPTIRMRRRPGCPRPRRSTPPRPSPPASAPSSAAWAPPTASTQSDLGRLAGYDGSYVGAVERAAVRPSHELVERCDRALQAGGALLSLWRLADGEWSTTPPAGRADPGPEIAHGPGGSEPLGDAVVEARWSLARRAELSEVGVDALAGSSGRLTGSARPRRPRRRGARPGRAGPAAVRGATARGPADAGPSAALVAAGWLSVLLAQLHFDAGRTGRRPRPTATAALRLAPPGRPRRADRLDGPGAGLVGAGRRPLPRCPRPGPSRPGPGPAGHRRRRPAGPGRGPARAALGDRAQAAAARHHAALTRYDASRRQAGPRRARRPGGRGAGIA